MPPASSTPAAAAAATADWRESYLESLHESERNDPVNRDLVAACSALADRVAALEAEKAVLLQSKSKSQSLPPGSSTSAPNSPPPTTTKPPSTATSTTTAAAAAGGGGGDGADAADAPALDAAQTRLDLAEALRSKGQLEAKLRAAEEELKRLRARARADERRVRDLAAERAALAAKLKDRGEELVEKNRMATNFQDEIVALTMELNLTEQKNKRITAENKELVDRWMKRMGEEADAMNLQNEPIINNRR